MVDRKPLLFRFWRLGLRRQAVNRRASRQPLLDTTRSGNYLCGGATINNTAALGGPLKMEVDTTELPEKGPDHAIPSPSAEEKELDVSSEAAPAIGLPVPEADQSVSSSKPESLSSESIPSGSSPQPHPEISSSSSSMDNQPSPPGNESLASDSKNREPKMDAKVNTTGPEHDLNDENVGDVKRSKQEEPSLQLNENMEHVKEVVQTQESSDQNSRHNAERAIGDQIPKCGHRINKGDSNPAKHSKPVNVITLAADNRGSSMETSNRDNPVHIHRAYKKSRPEKSDKENKTEASKGKDHHHTPQAAAYVNNNAQGINNSILFNVSITERNPGVHMIIARDSKTSSPQLKKPGIEPTYKPGIRRRCLRGLFLETSDSDADNTGRPRRHGCRVGCKPRDECKT